MTTSLLEKDTEQVRPAAATSGARLVVPAALVTAAVVGLAVGRLAAGGRPVLALLFPVLLVPILLWRSPPTGLHLLFAATVMIEQFEYQVGPRTGAVTAKIPFFHSVSSGSGLTIAELLVALLLVVCLLRSVRDRTPLLRWSPIGQRLCWLVLWVLVFLAVGLSRAGDVKMALWEIRPFLYLALAFLLADHLFSTRRALRGLWWILVIGCALKAAYGMVIWLSVRHVQPPPEAVLAHEESFFFGLYVFLTLGLWALGLQGRLRLVATALLPLVLAADMVNSRRTAWAVLICGGLVLFVVSFVRLPERRWVLARAGLAALVLLAAYLPAYWNKQGALAQPARALRSVIAPDARDEMSNKYRELEDNDLRTMIRSRHSLGTGFGLEIDYNIGIADPTSLSTSLAYVPHNGVLWIWMRTGIVGLGLFMLLLAQVVVQAARLARSSDRDAALLGIVTACAVVAYVIIGEKDLGFFWFRIAFAMGLLFGAVQAQTRLLALATPPATPAGPERERSRACLVT